MSLRVYATIVGLPRVPDEAWMRTLVTRHAEHPERVRIAELGLRRERLLGQGLELDSEARAETLALEALELGAGRRLQLGLEDHDVVD